MESMRLRSVRVLDLERLAVARVHGKRVGSAPALDSQELQAQLLTHPDLRASRKAADYAVG